MQKIKIILIVTAIALVLAACEVTRQHKPRPSASPIFKPWQFLVRIGIDTDRRGNADIRPTDTPVPTNTTLAFSTFVPSMEAAHRPLY